MTEQQRRAERFPLPLPLRYRISEASDWSYGRTQNISGSGVLFGADQEVAVGAQIDLWIALEADGECHPSAVLARARVVRVVAPGFHPDGAAMAASFESYEFLPRHVSPN